MPLLHTLSISFPEIHLHTRDAHKLRGFFGSYFREHSPLLHNHLEDGSGLRYAYPLVQYKVLRNVPQLLGLREGADLLRDLFLQIDKLEIEGKTYPVYAKNIDYRATEVGVVQDLFHYRFDTLWMALNEENYAAYRTYEDERRRQQLESILRRNLANVLKSLDVAHDKENHLILAKLNRLTEKQTRFKGNAMLAFEGSFTTNVSLPDHIGIGKAVSRGFGAIRRVH